MDMNGASQKNLADIDVEISNLIDKDLIMMGDKFADNWFSDEVQIRMKEIVKSL